MKAHREDCGINVKKILVYLSLKMRSLDAEIRYHAL